MVGFRIARVPWRGKQLSRIMTHWIAIGLALVVTGLGVAGWTTVQREREYAELIAVGDRVLTEGQTYGAIEAYSGALALKSDSMLAHLRRGETYRLRGELAAARRDLERAVSLDPTATRPLDQLGDVEAALGEHARAARYFERYLVLDDQSPRVLYKLALARYQLGRLPMAILALERAAALDPSLPELHYLLGLSLAEQRRHDEAIARFSTAIELSPSMVPARQELARVYAAEGRMGPEIEQLEALAALEPDRPERHASLGLAYARAGRPDAAVVALSRAAERFPDQRTILTALGEVWLESARRSDRAALGKALEALRSARDDGSSTSLALLGEALLLAGQRDEALTTLQRAAERLPVDPRALDLLARAASDAGDLTRSRRAEQLAYALAPEAVPTPETSRRIRRIVDLSLGLDRPTDAAEWMRRLRAAERQPDVALAIRVARACRAAGHLDAALALVDETLLDRPDDASLVGLREELAAAGMASAMPPG